MVDPHIWEDPSFNSLSLQARLVFIGLISNADDEGYFRSDGGSIKRLLFGFDELKKEQVSLWLTEIHKNIKSIHFFTKNKEVYGHFIKWNEYQKQKKDRILLTTYPKCNKCYPDVGQVPDNVGQLSPKVKGSKVKGSKVKYIIDEKHRSSPKTGGETEIYVRKPPDKQTQLQRICYFLEDILKTSIVNWGKQGKALKMMLKAGYTEEQIIFAIKHMANDEFYDDKAFDLMTIANNIDKIKAKILKKSV